MAACKQDNNFSMDSKFNPPKIYKFLPPNVYKDHILWTQSYFANEVKFQNIWLRGIHLATLKIYLPSKYLIKIFTANLRSLCEQMFPGLQENQIKNNNKQETFLLQKMCCRIAHNNTIMPGNDSKANNFCCSIEEE